MEPLYLIDISPKYVIATHAIGVTRSIDTLSNNNITYEETNQERLNNFMGANCKFSSIK